MSTQGFQVLCNIGPYENWGGAVATGPFSLNFHLISPKARFQGTFALAYQMEVNLRSLYLELADGIGIQRYKKLFQTMARFEDKHIYSLTSHYPEGKVAEKEVLQPDSVIEGGMQLRELPDEILEQLENPQKILSFCLAIESQAFDFYSRLANRCRDDQARDFFFDMADEEKAHLILLTNEMDSFLANQY
ncbi:MAG: hypothetical protein COB67_12245 [SAR324 cluster bacterium]|uniref:Rubrerythrin diiron-binding domain-containing protein n=1 Tax=SAR324 cluster bacterium TaxID=2024889 RepID=A0A2A4SS79_9DELT|nr:MAG: hypothetical protein COB67_12245 [SAR324 cluster bacterium]